MRTSYLSTSCAAAMCVFLHSFATSNQQPVNNNGLNENNGAVSAFVQDTVPRHSASERSGAMKSKPSESQSSTNQRNQNSDTRGEGTKKGRKGTEKEKPDTTNNGAVNTPQ